MGVKVSATKEEKATAPAITMLNSWNKRPVMPSMNMIGRNTAISVMVVETTAKKISLDPSIPALRGETPRSMRMYMFSVTTMASSTTSPTDKTTASMERTFMENPARYMTKNAPTRETGITTTGTSVTRQSLRKTNMMNTTRKKAMKMVLRTSLMEARMYSVLSYITSTETSSGRSFFICSTRSMASSAIMMWLAPG